MKTLRTLTVLLALAPASALATTQTGQLFINVKGADGNPVAGVTVEISSPEMIGGKKQGQSSADGTYRFINLIPGVYEVVGFGPNLMPAKVGGKVVQLNTTTQVELVMKPAATEDAGAESAEGAEPATGAEEGKPAEGNEAGEKIVVTGQRSVLDTERVSLGRVITDEFLEGQPITRDYQSVTLMLPGVVDSDGDGNPNIMGGTDYGNQYYLDGVNITDPVTNTFSANFNYAAMSQVEVITGGRDAEWGSAVGGVVNVVTKNGGNETHADVDLYYQANWMSKQEKKNKGLKNTDFDLGLQLGGPVMQDKLWYFASVELPFTQASIPNPAGSPAGGPFGEGNHPSRDFLGGYALGKLTWQQSDRHRVSLWFHTDPAKISNTLQSSSIASEAEEQQVQKGYRIAAFSDYDVSDHMLFSNRIAWSQNGLDIKPQNGDLDSPSFFNSDTGLSWGNDTTQYKDTRQRLQAQSALTYIVDDLAGTHQFKMGVDLAYTRQSVTDSLPGGQSFTLVGATNDPRDGLPSQVVNLVTPQKTAIWGDTEGVFVQDMWKPVSYVTIRPGVRFDSARMRNFEGKTQVVMNTFSPRVGASWDPTHDGKTQIHAGYYQYVDTGYLTLSDFANGNSKLTRTYDYNPVTGEYDKFVTESGGSNGVVGDKYLRETWNQKRPRTHEFLFGAGREVMDDLGVSFDLVYRYSSNQWEDTESNVIWDDSGSQVLGFRDGQAHYIYSLGALKEAFIQYYGAIVSVDKTFAKHWNLSASYTWSKTQGTEPSIINEAFDRPANRPFEYGYLPSDVRHAVKVNGSYEAPHGLSVGASGRYYSGEPYNRFFYNSFYGDYGDRRAERGFDTNGKELRLPGRYSVNASLTWSMKELTGHDAMLYVEGFNLTNNRQVVSVEERNLPDGSFGKTLDKMSPINFEVALKYNY